MPNATSKIFSPSSAYVEMDEVLTSFSLSVTFSPVVVWLYVVRSSRTEVWKFTMLILIWFSCRNW